MATPTEDARGPSKRPQHACATSCLAAPRNPSISSSHPIAVILNQTSTTRQQRSMKLGQSLQLHAANRPVPDKKLKAARVKPMQDPPLATYTGGGVVVQAEGRPLALRQIQTPRFVRPGSQ